MGDPRGTKRTEGQSGGVKRETETERAVGNNGGIGAGRKATRIRIQEPTAGTAGSTCTCS
jgi:hypothetical protein